MNPERWALGTRLAAGAASGLLLWVAFPPVEQGWVAVVALVPLLLALRGAGTAAGAGVGAAFATVFFGLLVWWISLFGFLAFGLLTAVHAAFGATVGGVGARLSASALGRVAGVPGVWVGVEMLRARWPLGGFTWGDIGYSQADGGTMLPLARLGGVYVLGLVVAVVNAVLAEMLTARRGRGVLAGAALVLVLAPGLAPMGLAGPQTGEYDLAGVQGNVEREAFTGFGRAGREHPRVAGIVANHIAVTERMLGTESPDLIVWPENSFDRDPRTNPELFSPIGELIARIGSPMVLPAILDADGGFTNTNLLVGSDGEVRARYDKLHLVPFGEYVPWSFARRVVPVLDAEIPVDGIPGQDLVVFDVSGARVGTLICFESAYPELARTSVRRGAQLLVVTTNNASFQESPAARQHLAMSRMRAVEHGRALAHIAISGVSALIEPDGTVLQRTGLFEQGLVRARLPLTTGQTPYARYGSAIEIAIGIGAALASVAAIALGRRRGETP